MVDQSAADGPRGPRRLNSAETATAAELRRIDQQLAGLFERGLGLADEIEEPGVRYLVAHVGRELSRAVISTLTGETVVSSEPTEEDAEVENRFRCKIAGALDLPETHPHVEAWFRSHQTLVKRVHWQNPPPSPDAIREAFVQLAGLLFGRLAPYFDTQAELDRLLNIDKPTADDVTRLGQCSIRYTQRRYFFSRVQHRGWLRPLAEGGFFKNPPRRLVHGDGSWSIQNWLEGQALARLAAQEPELATAEFLSVPRDNDNPGVWNTVATAALAIGPPGAVRLVPLLIDALKHAPSILFPRTIVNVIRMLAESGEGRVALRLTDALLFVRGGKNMATAHDTEQPQ